MSERCLHNEVCKYGDKRSNGMYCTEEKCKQFKHSTAFVEVVHGRWEWYEALVNPYALCSNCGCGLNKIDALNFDYCPYCGAHMKDGDGDG